MLRSMLSVLLGLGLLVVAQAESQARTIACGTLSKVKTGVDRAAEPMVMASLDFMEVPNSRIAFKVGGKGRSCVIVTYSARMQAVLPEQLWLRVVLDGKVIAEPGELVVTANDGSEGFGTRSYTWVFPAVSPGKRNVRVEYRSGGGSQVGIQQQTIVVQYR